MSLGQVFPCFPQLNVADSYRADVELLSDDGSLFGACADHLDITFCQLSCVNAFSAISAATPRTYRNGIGNVFLLRTDLEMQRVNTLSVAAQMPGDLAFFGDVPPREDEGYNVHSQFPTLEHDRSVSSLVVLVGLLYTVGFLLFQAAPHRGAEPLKRFPGAAPTGKRVAMLVLAPVVAMAQVSLMQRVRTLDDAAREGLASVFSVSVVMRTAHAFSQMRSVAFVDQTSIAHAGSAPLGVLIGVYH